jgi:hypothetical protein
MPDAQVPSQAIVQIPLADLQAIRRALNSVSGVTTRTRAGLAALHDVYAAYRLAFTDEERSKVIAWTRLQILEAPKDHFLHGLDAPDSFDAALSLLGTNAIREALGSEA